MAETLRPLAPRLRICMRRLYCRIGDGSQPGRCLRRRSRGRPFGRRVRLAGEHVAALDLVGLERPVGVHRDRALDDLGPAGAADAALAGEREVGAHPERGLQDGYVVGAQVERRSRGRRAGSSRGRRPRAPPELGDRRPRHRVGVEQLGVDAARAPPELLDRRAAARRASAAGRRGTTRRPRRRAPGRSRIAAQPRGVEPTGEQLDVLRLPREHVHDLQAARRTGPSGRGPRRGTSPSGGSGWRRSA